MSTFNLYKQYDDKIFYVNFNCRYYERNTTLHTYSGNLGIISIEDLENNIVNPQSDALSNIKGPYPIAVRYANNNIYAVERPPFQLTVDYSPTRSGRRRRPIKPVSIWIPWTVSIYDLSSVSNLFNNYRIFFNDQPIQSLDEELLIGYTSNMFGDSRICMGSSSNKIMPMINNNEIPSLQTLHNIMFNEYFSGGWNSDLSNNLYSLLYRNDSPYLIPSFTPTNEEHLQNQYYQKAIKNKIKFFSSHHYEEANLYYNLSVLTLEETISMVNSVKGYNYAPKKSLSSIISSTMSDSPANVDPINFTNNYSHNYCNVNLNLDNQGFALLGDVSRVHQSIRDDYKFIKLNYENIIDEIHEAYTKDSSKMQINLDFSFCYSDPSEVKEVEDVF